MATSNLMGTTLTTTDGNTQIIGFYVTPNKDCKIVAVIKSASCDATTATIYDSGKTLVATASFSGNTATFSGSGYSITNGANYYVMSEGFSTRHYGTAGSYPRARTDLTYTNNAYSSSLTTGVGEDANITDIQTSAGTVYPYEPTNINFTLTANNTTIIKSFTAALSNIAFTLTANNITFGRIYNFIANNLPFTLTVNSIITKLRTWRNPDNKSSTTYTNPDNKSTSTYTNPDTKSSTAWTNPNKNS